jgi:hypothetical protein
MPCLADRAPLKRPLRPARGRELGQAVANIEFETKAMTAEALVQIESRGACMVPRLIYWLNSADACGTVALLGDAVRVYCPIRSTARGRIGRHVLFPACGYLAHFV